MPFQPICGVCLTDCDRRGTCTSCSHFLCSRCLSRLPTAAPCPVCRQTCRMVSLDQPEIQPLLQTGNAALGQASRVIETQLRHHEFINKRMRQAMEMLRGQFQTLRRQREEETQKLRALESENRRLREQLARVAAPPTPQPLPLPSRSSSAASSPVRRMHRHDDGHTDLSGRQHTHQYQQPAYPPQVFAGSPRLSRSPSTVSAGGPQRTSSLVSTPLGVRLPPSAAEPAAPLAPLGWSASSHIVKRRQASDGAVASGSSHQDHREHLLRPADSREASALATPRSQVLPFLLHSRGSGSGVHDVFPPSPSPSPSPIDPTRRMAALSTPLQRQLAFRRSAP